MDHIIILSLVILTIRDYDRTQLEKLLYKLTEQIFASKISGSKN